MEKYSSDESRFLGIMTMPKEWSPYNDAPGQSYVITPDAQPILDQYLADRGQEQYGKFDTDSCHVFHEEVGRMLGVEAAGLVVQVSFNASGSHPPLIICRDGQMNTTRDVA